MAGDGKRRDPERKGEELAINRRTFLEWSGSAAAVWSAGALALGGLACRDDYDGRRVRLAVVGGNFGSKFYFDEHPGCEVVAVSDLREDRRRKLQRKYGCERAYLSLEALLAEAPALDAVALFTPAPDHVQHAKLCLERGLHVLSACPACRTLDEADELAAAVEQSGLRYMMAETSWYRAECILARQLYREGAFGELFYTEAEYYHDRGDLDALVTDKTQRHWEPDGSPSWRQGYPPMAYPTHALGFVVGVTGERIAKVSALGWGQQHPFLEGNRYDNPFWNESALMETERGHAVRCNVFWLVPGEGERAQWFGSEGALRMDVEGLHPAMQRRRIGDYERFPVPELWRGESLPRAMRHASPHGNSHVFITDEFITSLLEDRQPEIDIYESLAMTVPGLVAHQSALRGGEQLRVPIYVPPSAPSLPK